MNNFFDIYILIPVSIVLQIKAFLDATKFYWNLFFNWFFKSKIGEKLMILYSGVLTFSFIIFTVLKFSLVVLNNSTMSTQWFIQKLSVLMLAIALSILVGYLFYRSYMIEKKYHKRKLGKARGLYRV